MTRRRAKKEGQTSDHFISKFQTRPWEHRRGDFLVFDFETSTFKPEHSLSYFARVGVNAPATEKFLDQVIEKPCSRIRDRLLKAASFEDIEKALGEAPYRAIGGLFWLQSLRLDDARAKDSPDAAAARAGRDTLDRVAAEGTEGLDKLLSAVWHGYEPGLLTSPAPLFFPETGFFPLPTVGHEPALAMPLTPHILLTFMHRSVDRAQIEKQLNIRNRMTALSLGVSEKVRYVLVPPGVGQPSPKLLRAMRDWARGVFNEYGKISRTMGFKGYVAA